MFVYLVFHTFLFRRNVSQLQNMQIALIPQDERKLPKSLRASSLPLRISKYLTPFKTNPIENLDIKCLYVNTRGLNKSIKRRSVFRWIHNQNVHFTFLQESHSSKLSADAWSAKWGGKVFFSHGKNEQQRRNDSHKSKTRLQSRKMYFRQRWPIYYLGRSARRHTKF